MYDHRDRRNNQGYDRRGKGSAPPLPPPGPRFDRRDHNPPPSSGYYDGPSNGGKGAMNSNRNYYGRSGSPPPNRMMGQSYNNYRGGWKRK